MTADGWEIHCATTKCKNGLCDGSGYMLLIKNGDSVVRECECYGSKLTRSKIKSAQVPTDFEKVTIKSFDINLYSCQEDRQIAAKAKRIAAMYVQEFDNMNGLGKGLYLYSEEKGSGKSRLAMSILNALIFKYKIDGLYITTKSLLDEIKASFENNTTAKVTEIFKNVPVLVLDDLGIETVSEWSESIYTQILDERMAYKRPTIITSNLNIYELNNLYKQGRVASRVKKMTMFVPMPEEDVRAVLAEKENTEILEKFLSM